MKKNIIETYIHQPGPRVCNNNSVRMICQWSISVFTFVNIFVVDYQTCYFDKFLTIMKSVIDRSDTTATADYGHLAIVIMVRIFDNGKSRIPAVRTLQAEFC